MKPLILLAGLLYCVPCVANTDLATCDQYSGNQNACNSVNGCIYNNPDCNQCGSGSFCQNGTSTQCGTTPDSTGLSESEPGATGPNECYTPITCTEAGRLGNTTYQCRIYGDAVGLDCDDDDITAQFHAEWEQQNGHYTATCQPNQTACNAFPATVANTTSGDNINISDCPSTHTFAVGDAIWTNGSWDTSGCTYYIGNGTNKHCRIQLNDGTNNIDCMGSVVLAPAVPQPNNNIIPTVHTNIVYNRIASNTGIGGINEPGYLCYGCPDGYYVSANDLQTGRSQEDNLKYKKCVESLESFSLGAASSIVCNCTIAPRGYYTDDDAYGTCEFNYPFQFGNEIICAAYKCPVGKTTDNPGATAASACHYTNDTQFCDNNGTNCVSFSTLGIGWGDY